MPDRILSVLFCGIHDIISIHYEGIQAARMVKACYRANTKGGEPFIMFNDIRKVALYSLNDCFSPCVIGLWK